MNDINSFFLAQLFSEKARGIAIALVSSLSGGIIIVVCKKPGHFVISLLLLKIFTWNSEYVFSIQRAISTVKGDCSKGIFFFIIMLLFWLTLFILYQAPYSLASAPACSPFVFDFIFQLYETRLEAACLEHNMDKRYFLTSLAEVWRIFCFSGKSGHYISWWCIISLPPNLDFRRRWRKKAFNFLPNNNILGLYKLKAFADDKINVIENFELVLWRNKTLWEKEKMLVTSIFAFSNNVF